MSITKVLGESLEKVFHDKCPKEVIVDKIRKQWICYQNEDIPEEFYINPVVEVSGKDQQHDSYWIYALEIGGSEPSYAKPPVFRQIDHYSRKNGEICEDIRKLKYPHLLAFVK